jgi:hypothetical protein
MALVEERSIFAEKRHGGIKPLFRAVDWATCLLGPRYQPSLAIL